MSDRPGRPLSEVDSALYGLLESLLSEVDDLPRQEAGESREGITRDGVEKTDAETLKDSAPRPLEEVARQAGTEDRPPWAQGTFSALMFQVHGQALAIPVLDLAGVEPCPAKITPIPGQPDWHMGVLGFRDGKMIAVDLTRVLGLRGRTAEEARGCYLLAVDGGRFGFRCDAIPEPLNIDPDDVRWSGAGAQGRSGLLAGMLAKQMCPLLNVDHVLAQLRSSRTTETTSGPAGPAMNSNKCLPEGMEKTT